MKVKNKVLFTVITSFVILILLGGISYFTFGQKETQIYSQGKSITQMSTFQNEKRSGALNEKNITISNINYSLKYSETQKVSDQKFYDNYSCEVGKLSFNNNDKLSSFHPVKNKKTRKETTLIIEGSMQPINEQQAWELAKEHLLKMLGEEFYEYECDKVSDLQNATYSFSLSKKYADGIKGERGSIQVYKNGEICGWTIVNRGDYANFNESLVKNITQKNLSEFLDKKILEKYPKVDFEYSVYDTELVNDNGTFNIIVTAIIKADTEETDFVEFTYALV